MKPASHTTLSALLLLSGFLGIAPMPQATAQTAKTVTITVWDTTPLPESLMLSLNTTFLKQHPGIKLVRTAVPYNTYPAKVRAAMASGTGPDVYQLPAPQWVFQYGNGLMPLSKFITPAQRRQLQGWNTVSSGLSASGTPYALPWQIGGFTFYYNKKLFAQAGLNPTVTPTTWAQLVHDCAVLKAHKITPIAAGFQDGYYLQWFMDVIAGQLFTRVETDDFIQNPRWTGNAVLMSAIDDVKSLYNAGYFTPDSTGLGLFTAGLPTFAQGKAAMVLGLFGPVDYWGDFSKAIGISNLGTFAPPLVPGAKINRPELDTKVELGWAISKHTANPLAAYKYISFMTSAAAQAQAFEQTGVLPNITSARPQTSNPVGRAVLQLWESGRTYTAPISSAYEATTSSVMWQFATEVLTGKESDSAYLAAIQAAQTPQGKIP
jgi:ABC-type glycerol-3-phosphate transport system substrate-binding protein